jgi:hypothetical protein
MTRKDYKIIAQAIKDSMEMNKHSWKTTDVTDRQIGIIGLAETLAIRLQEDNPNFKSDVFYKACGI